MIVDYDFKINYLIGGIERQLDGLDDSHVDLRREDCREIMGMSNALNMIVGTSAVPTSHQIKADELYKTALDKLYPSTVK